MRLANQGIDCWVMFIVEGAGGYDFTAALPPGLIREGDARGKGQSCRVSDGGGLVVEALAQGEQRWLGLDSGGLVGVELQHRG